MRLSMSIHAIRRSRHPAEMQQINSILQRGDACPKRINLLGDLSSSILHFGLQNYGCAGGGWSPSPDPPPALRAWPVFRYLIVLFAQAILNRQAPASSSLLRCFVNVRGWMPITMAIWSVDSPKLASRVAC